MERYIKNPPDLRQIRTFLAVAEAGSFSNAAKQLFMTQPGVSTHITKLEHTLGYALLERYPRKVMLTSQGATFHGFAVNLFEQLADTIKAMNEDAQQINGWLKLAAPGSFGGFLLEQLSPLRALYPALRLSISYQPNHIILRDLNEGRLDVGFITQPPENQPQYLCEKIMTDEIVIVCAKIRTFSKHIVSIKQLNQLSFIDYPDHGHLLNTWVKHHFGKRAVALAQPDFPYFVNNQEAVIQLAAKGHGYAIGPRSATVRHALGNKLGLVSGPNPAPLLQPIYWTTRANQYLPKRVLTLKNYLLSLSSLA